MFNPLTGQVAPAHCGVNTCEVCGPLKAVGIGGAIALAGISRSITFTQVGDVFADIRPRMKRLRHRVAAAGHPCEWAWNVERNPKGTGNHAHSFVRSGFIPHELLVEEAKREGFGEVVWIQFHERAARTMGYGMKGITYGMKSADNGPDGLREHLELNGGRLVHTSRDFWRDEHGNPCGMREAIAAARRARMGGEGQDGWQLVRKADLGRAAEGPTTTS